MENTNDYFYIRDLDDGGILLPCNIVNNISLEIVFGLRSIGVTNNHMDIVMDYLTVSLCAETLSKFIEVIDSFYSVDNHKHYFHIRCICVNSSKLSDLLLFYYEMLTGELSNYDDIDIFEFQSQVSIYERGLTKRLFKFPELVDNYWANYVNGGIFTQSFESNVDHDLFLKRIYRRHPEYEYGFWKGAKSDKMKEDILFSTDSWLIPPSTHLSTIMTTYFDNVKFSEAEYISYKGGNVIVSDTCAVHFNQFEYFSNVSLKLINLIRPKSITRSTSVSVDLFGNEKTVKKRKMFCPEISNKNKYLVSEFGEIILITVDGYTSMFFDPTHLNFEELKELNAYLFPTYAKTQNLISRAIMVNCDWSKIDDDIFEQICYDIICLHPKFDSSTIRKMGKSKSRDGGRDITVKSKNLPGKDAELYVFQCKFYSNNTSLSASKLPNAGNTIMQYGAKGYGVFTTTVIDSTLFDMLDGFNQHQGIDVSICWSKYELERYINNNPILVNKYFKIDNATNSSKNS